MTTTLAWMGFARQPLHHPPLGFLSGRDTVPISLERHAMARTVAFDKEATLERARALPEPRLRGDVAGRSLRSHGDRQEQLLQHVRRQARPRASRARSLCRDG